jgi:NADH-quinone oxidoreductase subunit E
MIEIEGADIEPVLRAFTPERENLIPLLQEVQGALGYLPSEAISAIAGYLDIHESEVFGVASFYNQFRFNPPGKHPVKVCLGTACHIKGGEIMMESWERRLEIKEGETTEDREFSLERVACVGCCALAPVCLVEEQVYGKVMTSTIDGILLKVELEKEKKASESEE